ncbi:MAG: hypothetical protein EOO20_02305 [Chryseobacterium sp.]|nr:MAG: hypothetical protein EOO20_02305 [Chryseobacterium sp.]
MKNRTNFYWYASPETILETTNSMIIFSAENFNRALVIERLDELKKMLKDHKEGLVAPLDFQQFMIPFIFEKVIDLFKVCLFFENYMKAELMNKGFLIHQVNKVLNCDELAKKQYNEPVSARELHDVLEFQIDKEAKTIFHDALSSQTLTMKVLLGKKYLEVIDLPIAIATSLKILVKQRNELHVISEWTYQMSTAYIGQMEEIKGFVNKLFASAGQAKP